MFAKPLKDKECPYQIIDAGLFIAMLKVRSQDDNNQRLQHCVEFVESLFHAPPYKTVVVFDNYVPSTARKTVYADYKPLPTEPSKVAERKLRYRFLGKLRTMLNEMGYITCSPKTSKADGDDLLVLVAMSLSKYDEGVVVYTRDHDHLTLKRDNGIAVLNPLMEPLETEKDVAPKFATLKKSMVGKPNEVKGLPRFGNVAWTKLVHEIGFSGLQKLEEMLIAVDFTGLDAMIEEFPLAKGLKVIKDNLITWRASYYVARPHPEWLIEGAGQGILWGKRCPMHADKAERVFKATYNVELSKEVLARVFLNTSAPQTKL